ncbi:zinc transporter ZIP3-like [Diorhabda sublineata]|uniref:zinc transporter ZIP3-like n=1 Tax=Diorhabda sublineata TaxID=1163346 RepID=UPI0024E129CA|nr:zinc transporter ZIP3-like [Diorhabda sublineata]
MNLIATKILVAVLFFFIRFNFSILPVKLYNFLRKWEGEEASSGQFINHKRHKQVTLAIAFCQSFGGGVLFATCFLHMMLEVNNSVEYLKQFGDINDDYPLAQLAICLGFFFVYFLEEISHWAVTRIPDHPSSPNCEKKVFIIEEYNKVIVEEEEEEDKESSPIEKDDDNSIRKSKDVLSIDENHESIVFDSLSLNSSVEQENKKNADMDGDSKETEKKILREERIDVEIKSKQQVIRGVLVIVALSFHAIFEGLAIGLQKNIGNIWYMFIAVCIHSATILFCITLEMVIARVNFRAICIHAFGLAFSSTLGVFLGILVSYTSDLDTKGKSMAVVALEGLSAGTILYITFFEVLNREKERRIYRMSRAICILSGFSLMAFLQWYR